MGYKSNSESYKEAGVDITAGYKAVELMKKHIDKTKTSNATDEIGGFGGLFNLDLQGISNPVLVSGTDGVGTKLKLAFMSGIHNTVGIDCVAMCVNDVLCCGGRPLFFLDYIACGKNYPEKIEQIVEGICKGCIEADIPLVGGETAEMPGFYPEDEYDLAGMTTGIVDRDRIIKKENVKEGDVIIALPSSGVHSNGFSLVRKIIDGMDLNEKRSELNNKSLMETLLTPTKIYVKPIVALLKEILPTGIAHITGGGFYENIPRVLPEGLGAKISTKDLKILPIFDFIQKNGNIPKSDMFNTFNMGVGMIVVVRKEDRDKSIEILRNNNENPYVIGEIVKSDEKVILL